MSDEESRSPSRRRRPRGDYLRPRPVRRTPEEEEEAAISRLLAYTWQILSPTDQQAALHCAYIQGEAVAREFGGLPDGVDANDHLEGYRRSAIRLAFASKVINDVEYECWRFFGDDPRVSAFAAGVNAALGRTRAGHVRHRSSGEVRAPERELERLVSEVRRHADAGHSARAWLAMTESLGALSAATIEALKERLRSEGLLEQ